MSLRHQQTSSSSEDIMWENNGFMVSHNRLNSTLTKLTDPPASLISSPKSCKTNPALQRTAEYCGVLRRAAEYYGVLRSVAEYYGVLRSAAEYCWVLQSAAEYSESATQALFTQSCAQISRECKIRIWCTVFDMRLSHSRRRSARVHTCSYVQVHV